MASERQNGQKAGRSINDRACPSFIGSDTFVTLGWRDPADWTGLNCSSASFWLVFSARVSWLFYQWKVDNKPASRLIHNRPGPVRCENAWYRSVTSQQRAGPEKGDCG